MNETRRPRKQTGEDPNRLPAATGQMPVILGPAKALAKRWSILAQDSTSSKGCFGGMAVSGRRPRSNLRQPPASQADPTQQPGAADRRKSATAIDPVSRTRAARSSIAITTETRLESSPPLAHLRIRWFLRSIPEPVEYSQHTSAPAFPADCLKHLSLFNVGFPVEKYTNLILADALQIATGNGLHAVKP